MLHYCLVLIPRLETWTFLNEILMVALYFPWFSFIGTWIIAVAFYDGELFFTNVLVNYLLFSVIYSVSRMTGWTSPVVQPCNSVFFDLYRYIFPSATFIVTLTYYCLVVIYHRRKRKDWWNGQTWPAAILLGLVITTMPLAYAVSLSYYDIMDVGFILINLVVVVLLLLAITEASKHSFYWRQSVWRMNIYMGWKQ